MSGLFSPLQIKDLVLKNRIVMPPMCMNMATDGRVNEWHVIHYATRAIGGTGLIILEATAVSSEGKITPADLGIWEDQQVEGLKTIVDAVHQLGGKIGIQLAHAGRKASLVNERVIAPSSIPFDETYTEPEEMSLEDIERIVKAFGNAARRALAAGFDAIEIHGAHGYLINQFMSPLCNKRRDEYGGTLENRSRFLSEIIRSVRNEWPNEKPVILRVSAEEYDPMGNQTEEIGDIIKSVKSLGIDLINVSTGGVVPKDIITYPGYQLEIARKIKQMTEMPTLVGGLITDAALANEIVWNNRGDLVYLGRELLRNPYWPLQASKELGEDIEWPKPYLRSKVIRKFGF